MRGTRLAIGAAGALFLALLALSCASSQRVFVNPDADMAFYKKVAVLPFANLTPDGLAGSRVTRAFVTELILANRFQMVEPEDFAGSLQRAGITPAADGTYDLNRLKEIAKQAGITGILRGAVTEYQMERTPGGDVPVISFDAELMDDNTGNVVWRSSISKHGRGRLPILGSGSRSLGRLTQEACVELVAKLRKEAL